MDFDLKAEVNLQKLKVKTYKMSVCKVQAKMTCYTECEIYLFQTRRRKKRERERESFLL
jgi:hypothetical protein